MSIPIMPSMTNTEGRMVNAELEIFVNGIKREIEPTTILVDLSQTVGYVMKLIINEIKLFKSDNVLALSDRIESVNSNFLSDPNDPDNILDIMSLDPSMPLVSIHYSLDIETATLYVNIQR